MVNRKQMPSRHPGKTTLKDVLARFSEEERKLLREWQNVLYKNVMNEIHQALHSLGPAIAASIFSLQAEENEDLDHADATGLERRNIDHNFLSAAISNEDALNKMREPEASLHTDSMKISNVNRVLTSTRFKDEEGTVTIVDQDAKEIQDIIYPTGFPSLAHESEVSYMNSTDGEGIEDGRRASQGHEARTMVTSVFIKEEEATDPTALMDHKERQDILGSAGFSSFTSEQVVRGLDRIDEGGGESWIGGSLESEGSKILLPPSFKEELTDSTGDQDSTEMPYISYPLGFPSPTSEPAVSYVDPIDGGGGGGGEGSSRASPGNQNRRNTAEEDRIRVKQEERLEFGNRRRHTYKNRTEKCIQSLHGEEALPGEASETALLPSWKRRTNKRSTMPQRKKRNTIKRTVKSTDCEIGASNSENSTEQQQTTKLPVQSYTCPECGKVFTMHSKLTIHLKLHTGSKPYVCDECGKSYRMASALTRHKQTHTGERPYECDECGKSFNMAFLLSRHKQIHTLDRPYKCTECGNSYKNVSSLRTHQRRHSGRKPYACSKCGKCFVDSSSLLRHQKTHTDIRPHACSECGKCFFQPSALVAHQRMHTRSKAFTCSECGKSFIWLSACIRHQKLHSGIKSFVCKDCGKCFAQSSSLFLHQKTHTGVKPYVCSICGKCYKAKSSLVGHHRSHTGVKPFACSECGKCFRDLSVLIRHQRIHTGLKPYTCSECGNSFNQSSTLKKHSRIHARNTNASNMETLVQTDANSEDVNSTPKEENVKLERAEDQ